MPHPSAKPIGTDDNGSGAGDDRTLAGGVPFLRHLGLAERLFYLYGERFDVDFCLAAEIDGRPDEQQLISAFAQVVDRHPLLTAQVEVGPNGHLAFFDERPATEIAIHRVAKDEWPSFVTDSLAHPLGKDGSAMVRATVLLEAQAAAIILTFHHAVANGRSAVTVLTDLLAALSGQGLLRTELPASLEGYAGFENEIAQFDQPVGRSAEAPHVASITRSDKPGLANLLIDEAETDALLATCHEHRASLHGALCVALATVLRARRASDAEINVFSAVDLSDAVGAPDDVCAFLNGAVTTPIDADQNFWEAARAVSAAAAAYREPAAVRAALEGMAAALPADASPDVAVAILGAPPGADVEVTNLGALSVDQSYDALKISRIWGPMPCPKVEGAPIVGVVGFQGVLHLTQTSWGHADTLLEDMRDFLRQTVLADPASPH